MQSKVFMILVTFCQGFWYSHCFFHPVKVYVFNNAFIQEEVDNAFWTHIKKCENVGKTKTCVIVCLFKQKMVLFFSPQMFCLKSEIVF